MSESDFGNPDAGMDRKHSSGPKRKRDDRQWNDSEEEPGQERRYRGPQYDSNPDDIDDPSEDAKTSGRKRQKRGGSMFDRLADDLRRAAAAGGGGGDDLPRDRPAHACCLDEEAWDYKAELRSIRQRVKDLQANKEPPLDPTPLFDEGVPNVYPKPIMDPDFCAACEFDHRDTNYDKIRQMYDHFFQKDLWECSFKAACSHVSRYYAKEIRSLPKFANRNWERSQVAAHFLDHGLYTPVHMAMRFRQLNRMCAIAEQSEGLAIYVDDDKAAGVVESRQLNERTQHSILKLVEAQTKVQQWIEKFKAGKL